MDGSERFGPEDRGVSVLVGLLRLEQATAVADAPREKALPSRLVGRSAHLLQVAERPQGHFLAEKRGYSPSAEEHSFVDGWVKARLVPNEEALQKLAAPGMLVVGFYIHWALPVAVLFAWEVLHPASERSLRLAVGVAWVRLAFPGVTWAVRLVHVKKMLLG